MSYRFSGTGLIPAGWMQTGSGATSSQQSYSMQASSYTTQAAKPSCASDAQKKQADYDCRNAVRGLGAAPYTSGPFAGMDPCAVAKLPTCITFFGTFCPQGQIVDPTTKKCVTPSGTIYKVTATCPSGQVPQADGTCLDASEAHPSCPSGQHFDPSTNGCVPDSSGGSSTTPTSTYLMWGGLALLLVAGGGYVAYKATR